jgi:hypothetical protein
MIKFTRLFVLSVLIFWIAVSGCIGGNAPEEKEAGKGSTNISPKGENTVNLSSPDGDLDVGLSQAELKELDSDMADLEDVLENSSLGENLVIEDVEMGSSKNMT